jgi:prepilin-type N-terminal cleavage/methylation domain-containing protein
MRIFAKKQKLEALKSQKGFTLIEVLFALVLIGVAVAMMVGYYGNKFYASSADATAVRIGDDMRATKDAVNLYKIKESAIALAYSSLVNRGYLSNIPTKPNTSFSNYSYSTTSIAYKNSGTDTAVFIDNIPHDVCKSVNATFGNSTAVPTAVDTTKGLQCWGPSGSVVANNRVVLPIFVPTP